MTPSSSEIGATMQPNDQQPRYFGILTGLCSET